MICICAVKTNSLPKGVLLSREEQLELCHLIRDLIGYTPFVFNTQRGLYIFFHEKDCSVSIITQLKSYLTNKGGKHSFVHAYQQVNYFENEITQVLNDTQGSSLAWKNFISSFLIQLDPFEGEVHAVYGMFNRFVAVVKSEGNLSQLDHLKQKMNRLRSKVNLSAIMDG